MEDVRELQDYVKQLLEEHFGMNNKLGEARNVTDAVALIKKLAEQGKPVDLVILDRQFPYEADEIDALDGGDQVLRQIEKLAQDPKFRDMLKDTRVIMMTSHVREPGAMDEFRALSSRVIGGVDKGTFSNNQGMTPEIPMATIKKCLVDAGVVEKDS